MSIDDKEEVPEDPDEALDLPDDEPERPLESLADILDPRD